jgi:tetratricopeptide (TPR) repeat protein
MLSVLVWALALSGPPPDGGAQAGSSIETLDMGIEAYRRGDFETAVRTLSQAATQLGKDTPHAARAHLFLGFSLVALGQEPQAEAEFERALQLDDKVDASSASPKIREVFQKVARRIARLKKDEAPPEVQTVTVFPVAEGAPLDFMVEATDASGVGAVRVQYRVRGGKTWGVLPLTPASPNQFAGALPPVAALPPGIEYYVEAWDRLGNGPARVGSAEKPRFVEVHAGVAKDNSHFYEKWWFWTAIGAAVAGGTAAALTVGRDKTVHVTVTGQ